MKINHKQHPHIDDTRIRVEFLWFLQTLEFQTRWLEWASWDESTYGSIILLILAGRVIGSFFGG